MERWKFKQNNNDLIKLVLTNKKTATSYLYRESTKLPIIGEESILCYDNDTNACIIKTTDYKIIRFKDVTEDDAKLEGEGDLSLEYWKNTHYSFFKIIDPSFNENSKIVLEIFEVKR